MDRGTAEVFVDDLTDRQLLLHIYDRINGMEAIVAELSEAVADLQAAVDGVATRLLTKVETLEAALEAAQADDAVAAGVLAEAQAATADIRAEVDQLNALGTDPEPAPEV